MPPHAGIHTPDALETDATTPARRQRVARERGALCHKEIREGRRVHRLTVKPPDLHDREMLVSRSDRYWLRHLSKGGSAELVHTQGSPMPHASCYLRGSAKRPVASTFCRATARVTEAAHRELSVAEPAASPGRPHEH